MKVFISWSGDTSKAIAEILKGWLPSVIQAIKPYFSPDDIAKGTRWSGEISNELQESKFGLICLTAENLEAPWIMFEAGALSKSIVSTYVCPLLFGIEPADVKGPLVQFQAAPFTEDEMKKTIRTMNDAMGQGGLASEVLESVFKKWWPDLDEKIKIVMANAQRRPKQPVRSERDILEEVLARVRAIRPTMMEPNIHPRALIDLQEKFLRLKDEVGHLPSAEQAQFIEIVNSLQMPIDYIVRHSDLPSREAPLVGRERILGRSRIRTRGLDGSIIGGRNDAVAKLDDPNERL